MTARQYRFVRFLPKDAILMREEWEKSEGLIQVVNKKYDNALNYLTRIIGINYDKEKYPEHNLKEGDLVFLSRYFKATKALKIGMSPAKYHVLPISLVLGVFRNEIRTLNNLEVFDDKVLIEEVQITKIGLIHTPGDKECVTGRVVKAGKGGFLPNWKRKEKASVQEGDVVLYWNNISTPVVINDKKYRFVEDARIVGKFISGIIDLNFIELLDGQILLKNEVLETLEGSNIVLPTKDIEADASTIPENRFRVVKVAERGIEIETGVFSDMEGLKEGDIVIANADLLQHVKFNGTQYYVGTIEDLDCIIGTKEG